MGGEVEVFGVEMMGAWETPDERILLKKCADSLEVKLLLCGQTDGY